MPARDPQRAIGAVRRDGSFEPLGLPLDRYSRPRVSPDGRYVAYEVQRGTDSDVDLFDLRQHTTLRLARDGTYLGAAWRADSRAIAAPLESDNPSACAVSTCSNRRARVNR